MSLHKFCFKFVFISADGEEGKSHFGDGNADAVVMNVSKPKENIGTLKLVKIVKEDVFMFDGLSIENIHFIHRYHFIVNEIFWIISYIHNHYQLVFHY